MYLYQVTTPTYIGWRRELYKLLFPLSLRVLLWV